MISKIAHSHPFYQFKPCGDGSIDVAYVSLDFTEFLEFHLCCLFNLKCQNSYTRAYRGAFWGQV